LFCASIPDMTRVRRTQAERTAATRGALLDATVGCLVERGYRGTTTTDVARRAGVSNGALLHHFPTKADLLCAAVGHLFAQRNEEFRKAMADLPPGVDRTDAGVDLLWSLFRGPTFVAWLELWLAARTDAELAEPLARLDADFLASSEAIFREFFADEAAAAPDLPRLAVALTFSLLNGLAVSRLVPGYDPIDTDEVVEVFKTLIRPALPSAEDAR
jgi:AcrR family transcriptional regulator